MVHRPVWAEVSLGAIAANVAALRAEVAPAEVLAVVKADGYGHGALEVSRTALTAGGVGAGRRPRRGRRAVARAAGIDAPVLVLSEPVAEAADAVVQYGLTPVVYTPQGIESLAKAVAVSGARTPWVSISKSTPGCTASVVAPKTRSSSPCKSQATPSSIWPERARTSQSPTSPTTPTPPSRLRASPR